MAYLEILAEGTTEVAVGDEDGSRTAPSHQGGFLPEMGVKGRHYGMSSCAAKARLAGQPVDGAVPRAESAGLEKAQREIHPFPENPRVQEITIKRSFHIGARLTAYSGP